MLSKNRSFAVLAGLAITSDLVQAKPYLQNKKLKIVEQGEYFKTAADGLLNMITQLKPAENIHSPFGALSPLTGPVGCSICWMGMETIDYIFKNSVF